MITLAFALAQATSVQCWPTLIAYDGMARNYGEERVFAGDAGPVIIETGANAETGSWSIMATSPDGQSCLMAHGLRFRMAQPGQ